METLEQVKEIKFSGSDPIFVTFSEFYDIASSLKMLAFHKHRRKFNYKYYDDLKSEIDLTLYYCFNNYSVIHNATFRTYFMTVVRNKISNLRRDLDKIDNYYTSKKDKTGKKLKDKNGKDIKELFSGQVSMTNEMSDGMIGISDDELLVYELIRDVCKNDMESQAVACKIEGYPNSYITKECGIGRRMLDGLLARVEKYLKEGE